MSGRARSGCRRDERGAVLVLTALALGSMFGLAALAIDIGNLAQVRQGAQAAVDSAAVSGAQLLAAGTGTLGSVVSTVEEYVHEGYPSIPVGTDPSGAAAWRSCPPSSVPAGFVTPDDARGDAQSCVAFDSSVPPGSPGSARVVHVSLPPQSVGYSVGRAVGNEGVTGVSASASASFKRGGSPCALCVLGSSGTTLSAAGGSSLAVAAPAGGTAIVVDSASTDPPAVVASGTSSVTASGTFAVVGGVSGVTGTTTLASPLADPLAFLGTPTWSGLAARSDPDVRAHGTATIEPGIYASITAASGSLSLAPGEYVVTGKLSVGAQASVSGDGVTLLFTCGSGTSPTACAAGESGGSLDLAAGSTFSLAAPQSGPDAGLLVFYDPNDAAPLTLAGHAGSTLAGTVYAAGAPLSLTGSASSVSVLGFVDVASVELTGGASATIDYSASGNVSVPAAARLCSLVLPDNC